ncbi:kinase-like domain-containing protein, partial [Thelephora terrestris]
RHAFVCRGLSHTNIVPFLGVFSSEKFPYACIFESIGKENLKEYLLSNPGCSRLKSLAEVARGLHHIHDLDTVHGSIRGANIRIDEQGTARIAGFASATLPDVDITPEDVDVLVEARWCSPELLQPGANGLNKARATKASDMYAFGMLAYEVFSGQVPFHDKQNTVAVITAISTDERPPRPTHQELSDQLWELIEKCWQTDPSHRPTIREVVAFMSEDSYCCEVQVTQ